jgi:hypothetical protein
MPVTNIDRKTPTMPEEQQAEDVPGHGPAHTSEGVWYEFLEGNPKAVNRMFSTFDAAKEQNRTLVASHFDHKDYEARNIMLRKFASVGMMPSVPSLREQTKGLLPK